MTTWIWQQPQWPNFTWSDAKILPKLRQLHQKIGFLLGQSSYDGQSIELSLETLLSNIIASSAIENEKINVYSLRSSLARRLGLSAQQSHPSTQRSEGLANILFDALNNIHQELTVERLFQWHEWLFAEPDWTTAKIRVGQWRGEEPMQVVSGRIDKPTIHFEAPPRSDLAQQMMVFIDWFNQSRHNQLLDPLLRAAISHFWFVTLHPFDDGNGRITRTLTDLALAQMDRQSIRLYAMSSAILQQRQNYYRILEQSQKGNLDISEWLLWFLETLELSVNQSLQKIERTLLKARFWQYFAQTDLHEAQRKVLNRLLDGGGNGFEQGISAAQYQKVAKVSKATATRHLTDMLEKSCLKSIAGGGRSVRYQVNLEVLGSRHPNPLPQERAFSLPVGES